MSDHWLAGRDLLLIGSAVLNVVYYNKVKDTSTAYEQTQQELLAVNERMKGMDKDTKWQLKEKVLNYGGYGRWLLCRNY